MMQNTSYSLAEYKIIENQHGDLWWETHIGLGSLVSGKCFINGNILFIKPSSSTGPGFLKGEFLDHLNKLPKWEKTKYYCTSCKIYECKSGRIKPIFEGMDGRLQKEAVLGENGLNQKWVAKGARKPIKLGTTEHVSYKLRRHEIIEKNDGRLFWKSHDGLVSFKKGRCHINGNILFLEPGETMLSRLKKEGFLQQLAHLPNWKKTRYFCPSYAIYYSKTGAICRRLEENKALKRDRAKKPVIENETSGTGIKIKPIISNKIITEDKLKTFFNFCNIWVMLILRLLLGCFQMMYKAIRVLIGRWDRFRN